MSEINRFRLEWECRRGMRELDKMIMPFYKTHFDALSAAQQQHFADFLKLSDPELFRYLMLQQTPENPDWAALVTLIRQSIAD